ncbi:transposase-like zinc-binding domain-containing protein [Comamonas jiangduensis]|uniref:transposase-like zinc-binding domain-containing protein n=1 Tax=Comamonas jiangduensis TaxID=1194168 RepID=UPI003D67E703
MQCSRCNHHHTQKIGLSRHKRQRWMCMGCHRTFGDKDLRLIDPKIKALALAMYAEGIAARKIERLLHVSHNAVLWLGAQRSCWQSTSSCARQRSSGH